MSELRGLNMIAADWWGERWQDDGSRFAFKLNMVNMLPDRDWLLYSDYDPQDLLLEIVRKVKPDCRGCLFSSEGLLPYKTGLKRENDRLYAHEGYGTGWRELNAPEAGAEHGQ